MRLLPKGSWQYGLLLFLLFVIAALAARDIIQEIIAVTYEVRNGARFQEETIEHVVVWPILALVGGLLFMSGGLGIWMMRVVAEREARERVSNLVSAMDYIKDGVVVLDRRGRLVAMNPVAKEWARTEEAKFLRDAFPAVTSDREELLLDPILPREVEGVDVQEERVRVLRFRSQPHRDMTVVLISDITETKAVELRRQRLARVQLMGRIAEGVAHDFSNILCAISGFLSLLEKQGYGTADSKSIISGLHEQVGKGARVVNRLLDLCHAVSAGEPCQDVKQRIEDAAALLRVGLGPGWGVVTEVEGPVEPTALTDVQVEQIIVSLGMIAADEHMGTGLLHIKFVPVHSSDVSREPLYVGTVLIAAFASEDAEPGWASEPASLSMTSEEGGVLFSVMKALVEEAGGQLQAVVRPSGKHTYRLVLPRALREPLQPLELLAGIPEAVRTRLRDWTILFGFPRREDVGRIARFFEDLNADVSIATDIVALLQQTEAMKGLKGLVVALSILGEEWNALLKALRKLRPATAIVVVQDVEVKGALEVPPGVIVCPPDPTPEAVLEACLKAEEAIGKKE